MSTSFVVRGLIVSLVLAGVAALVLDGVEPAARHIAWSMLTIATTVFAGILAMQLTATAGQKQPVTTAPASPEPQPARKRTATRPAGEPRGAVKADAVPRTADKAPAAVTATAAIPSGRPRSTGTVKWFNIKKGYGFITVDGGDDVFLHIRNIQETNRRTLADGQRVEFVITAGDKGPQAEEVSIID